MPTELSRITGSFWKKMFMTYLKVSVLTYDWKGGRKYDDENINRSPGVESNPEVHQ
jgi:hypothetical protein